MQPSETEPRRNSDRAWLGILVGLVLGVATAVVSFYIAFLLTYERQISHFYSTALVAVLNLLPPGVAVCCGLAARGNKQPRFAAGFFVAAALLFLLEASCAMLIRR
jgi:cytochrome bd-type quinol oxidase subunit 2